jgi:hypothetical protein
LESSGESHFTKGIAAAVSMSGRVDAVRVRLPARTRDKVMPSLNIVPLTSALNRLTDIHQVTRRLDSEAAMFDEVRDVLKRHGVEKKYGLALLHKHFDLAEDEVLMEYTDLENRTLTMKPARRSEAMAGNAIETLWSLDSGNATIACVVFCYSNPGTGQHVGHHDYRPS